MAEPYLYVATSPHLQAFNTLVDQGLLFIEQRWKQDLKKFTFGILYGVVPLNYLQALRIETTIDFDKRFREELRSLTGPTLDQAEHFYGPTGLMGDPDCWPGCK